MMTRMAYLFGGLLLLSSAPTLAQDAVAECDRLAASPLDASRPAGVAGVSFGQIDTTQAQDTCRAALEASNEPRLAFQLGRAIHQDGHFDEAASFYEDAAMAGHADAMVGLSQVLNEITRHRSAELLEQAAAKGSINGIYNLAVFARDQQSDGAQALKLFADAAARGDAEAAYNAAVLYDEGDLVMRNAAFAERYYRQALNAGHASAKVNLAYLLFEKGRSDAERAEALTLFQASTIEDEDTNSGLQLGLLIQNGSAEEQDVSEKLILAALAERDLELAKFLQDGEARFSERNLAAVLAEIGAASDDEFAAKLGAYYADN